MEVIGRGPISDAARIDELVELATSIARAIARVVRTPFASIRPAFEAITREIRSRLPRWWRSCSHIGPGEPREAGLGFEM